VRLISLQTVARKLDVDPKTIRRWVASGLFPAPLLLPAATGKEPIQRWALAAVEAWILSRCQEKKPGTNVD
jgi:predicted DNA-binding transcriptional regulator AlpA